MPLYEYVCNSCGSQFEVLVFATAGDNVHCPECGAEDVKKLLSSFATTGSDAKNISCSSGRFS